MKILQVITSLQIGGAENFNSKKQTIRLLDK